MRTIAFIAVFALASACTSDPDDPTVTDTGQADAAAPDMNEDATTETDATADAAVEQDAPTTFCETASCAAETPQCSELLQRCVQCTASSDCATAPLLTCETFGDGAGGEPLYECVECVDDTVCGGGTCDLTMHVCVP